MSTEIEKKAKKYLLNEFESSVYKFIAKKKSDQNGFDIWLRIRRNAKIMIEIKAADKIYKKESDIFSNLSFSSKKETEFFKNGESRILRIFLLNNPPKLYLIDHGIMKGNVRFKREYRAKLIGKKDLKSKSIKELKLK